MKQEMQEATRFAQGAKIALYGRIVKVKDKQEWRVFSMTHPNQEPYTVKEDGSCNCPDYQFRGAMCKHAYGVDIRYSVMRTVREIA